MVQPTRGITGADSNPGIGFYFFSFDWNDKTPCLAVVFR